MPFPITPNVKVKKDQDGIVRGLSHPQRKYTGDFGGSFGIVQPPPVPPRMLAEQYIRDVHLLYQLEPDIVEDINSPIGPDTVDGTEGARLKFQEEKNLGDQATVTYAQ